MTTEFVDTLAHDALQMLDNGAAPQAILAQLTMAAEKVSGEDTVASILVVGDDGLLHNGASPKLPADYLKAIDGISPHPNLGTCAAAAATGNMVITKDFCADDKWAELRHLPLALGFLGAWSMPIKNSDGKVLGTFGTYYRENREPSKAEIDAVSILAQIAAKVLYNGRD